MKPQFGIATPMGAIELVAHARRFASPPSEGGIARKSAHVMSAPHSVLEHLFILRKIIVQNVSCYPSTAHSNHTLYLTGFEQTCRRGSAKSLEERQRRTWPSNRTSTPRHLSSNTLQSIKKLIKQYTGCAYHEQTFKNNNKNKKNNNKI